MHHSHTLHEIVRLERADALRRTPQPRIETPDGGSDSPPVEATIAVRIGTLLRGLRRSDAPAHRAPAA